MATWLGSHTVSVIRVKRCRWTPKRRSVSQRRSRRTRKLGGGLRPLPAAAGANEAGARSGSFSRARARKARRSALGDLGAGRQVLVQGKQGESATVGGGEHHPVRL